MKHQFLKNSILSFIVLCLATELVNAESPPPIPNEFVFDFLGEKSMKPARFSAFGNGSGPRLQNGIISLLEKDVKKQFNVLSFDCQQKNLFKTIELQLQMRVIKGSMGLGIALLDTNTYGEKGPGPFLRKWESPNLFNSFAVGVDTHNPPHRDLFNEHGNFYGKPQREISLHWNGREIVKRLSPVKFKDGQFHAVLLSIQFVSGGAHITFSIDKKNIYERYFIPGMGPYETRLAMGARARSTKHIGECDIKDIRLSYQDPTRPFQKPIHIRVFDKQNLNPKQKLVTREIELPRASVGIERIILSLNVTKPLKGWDIWDRFAAIYLWDENGERYEIVRYITAYARECFWKIDVTDYQYLLREKAKIGIAIGGWFHHPGFDVSINLDYYKGTPKEQSYKVINLWKGSFSYGSHKKPFGDFQDKRVQIDKQTTAAKLHIMTTGHGQIGEFTPAKRSVIVNETSFSNTLWKDDCYLNPIRPQGGTWKFSRAGWAPGAIVDPWRIDISALIQPGHELLLRYQAHSYPHARLQANNKKLEANHNIESQLILYRAVDPTELTKDAILMIVNTNKDSRAEKIGLKKGDFIYSYDGKEILSIKALRKAIAAAMEKKKVALVIHRGLKTLTFTIEPGQIGVQLRPKY